MLNFGRKVLTVFIAYSLVLPVFAICKRAPSASFTGHDSLLFDLSEDLNQTLSRCQEIDNHGQDPLFNNSLTPFWAQELIGGDLAYDFMQGLPSEETRRVSYGTYEGVRMDQLDPSSYDRATRRCSRRRETRECRKLFPEKGDNTPHQVHGTQAATLISGHSPYSITPQSRLEVYEKYGNTTADHGVPIPEGLTDQMINQNIELLTASHTLIDTPSIKRSIDRLHKKGVIIIHSAGNAFPIPVERDDPWPEKMITVGSVAPTGFTSFFSDDDHHVDITAPSDWFLASHNGEHHSLFSGTSGAAPLVSAAVINVQSLLPGITLEEVRTLLRRTAMPNRPSIVGRPGTGAGVLNAYRLARVARRLQQEGWPINRHDIEDTTVIYDFKQEAIKRYKHAQKLLASRDSCVRKVGLKTLRQAFFLDPSNRFLRRQLIQQYRRLGYYQNAQFYDQQVYTEADVVERANRTNHPAQIISYLHFLYQKREGAEAAISNKVIAHLQASGTPQGDHVFYDGQRLLLGSVFDLSKDSPLTDTVAAQCYALRRELVNHCYHSIFKFMTSNEQSMAWDRAYRYFRRGLQNGDHSTKAIILGKLLELAKTGRAPTIQKQKLRQLIQGIVFDQSSIDVLLKIQRKLYE